MTTVSRLIATFVPDHYDLSLTINRQQRTFNGTVTIHGTRTDGSDSIVFHSKDLSIDSVTINGKHADFAVSSDDELHITHPDFSTTPPTHIVVIRYSGTITDGMHGMYPCYYEHDGVKKELIATQFESHHAREVFPCVDEPEAKATFDVTLSTEAGVSVLGNMPITRQSTDDVQLVTTFETTPRMSTYLLAWVVGELHSVSGKTTRGVDVSIWATPAQSASSLTFALDIATRSIDFYEQYFDTEYPLPKSDHVALPDFSSGAMENWGLITYREIALLADPATSGISSKQYIATVIAHELAHQWFGNLVTMKWWNNLWLNESFATLMEYVAVDALEPSWNIWLDFSSSESVMALRRDAIDGVQPVQTDVNHPDEISTLFDGAIVYAKGARLLRMLQTYVGSDAFQQGLKAYFAAHAYGNTEADDLWSHIATASGKDIVAMMNTWISQPGYPVVSVEQTGNTVTVSQKQFFIGPHDTSARIWPIPLNSSCSEMPALLDTFSTKAARTHDTLLSFNVGDSAHFITQYSPALLGAHIEAVRSGKKDVISRLQLIDETILLVRAGELPSVSLIELIDAYRNETSEHVWSMLYGALAELRKFVESDEEAEARLRHLSASIAHAEYERLGWHAQPGESDDDTKLRATILSMMLYGEDRDALEQAASIYASSPLEELDPELRPLIISSVVRHGDASVVKSLMASYTSTHSAELRDDISSGITSTRVAESIAWLLDSIKDPSTIKPQDAARWFVYLIRGRDSRDQAWQWIRDNWQWVMDTFSGDKSLDYYPRYVASALMTRQQMNEYSDFFTPKKSIPALTRVIAMGISEIEGRVELIEREGPAVVAALKKLA